MSDTWLQYSWVGIPPIPFADTGEKRIRYFDEARSVLPEGYVIRYSLNGPGLYARKLDLEEVDAVLRAIQTHFYGKKS